LKEIDLTANNIGNNGAKYLAEVIRNNIVSKQAFDHFLYFLK